MDKSELLTKLVKIDDDVSLLFDGKMHIKVIIGGGSALIIKDCLFRQTPDIDVIGIYKELDFIFNKYDMNSRMNAFLDCLPENYEDRLEYIDLPTKTIDYFTLSLEDLVIMKLFSNRQKDYFDITRSEVVGRISFDIIEKIINSGELNTSFNDRKYKEFLNKYEQYKKDFKKK